MTAKTYSLPLKLALGAEALVALARARLGLYGTAPADVLRRNTQAAAHAARRSPAVTPEAAAQGRARIAFVIPRVVHRLPWRADCLVQALAGQAMLRRRSIASTIEVGTAKHPDGRFEAHAWLVCDGEVVLGGDISRFEPLLEGGERPVRKP
ncbi:MAG: lasso peptide biosynthesis B2 protein [Erythrobacter sp.]